MPTTTTAPVVELKPNQLIATLLGNVTIDLPTIIWGPPGIGKSEMARQVADARFAADYGYSPVAGAEGLLLENAAGEVLTPMDDRPWFRDVRAQLIDPIELMGLPSIDKESGEVHYARPSWLPKTGTGMVLLDELNRAPVQTMNGLLQLALDRRIGPHRLAKGWVLVAACNRAQDGGGVNKMPYALRKRFDDLHAVPDLDEWTQWAIKNDLDPLVIGYVRFCREHFYSYDRDTDTGTDPRSWYFASKVTKARFPQEQELASLAGLLGYGIAGELSAFLRVARRCPSVDAILMNPTQAIVPGPTEASALYAVSASLSRAMTDGNAEAAITYLERMPLEYAAFAVKDAVLRDEAIAHTMAFTGFVTRHPEIM